MSTKNKQELTLGQKIRLIRELKGYKQDFVATQLNMTQNGYGKIERDETDVSFSRLTEIAKILEVSVSDILNVDENKIQHSISHPVGGSNHILGSNYNAHFNYYDAEKEVYEKLISSLERENQTLREMLELFKSK
jgi:transcriptional regulator with XRE-family HTH domain